MSIVREVKKTDESPSSGSWLEEAALSMPAHSAINGDVERSHGRPISANPSQRGSRYASIRSDMGLDPSVVSAGADKR